MTAACYRGRPLFNRQEATVLSRRKEGGFEVTSLFFLGLVYYHIQCDHCGQVVEVTENASLVAELSNQHQQSCSALIGQKA